MIERTIFREEHHIFRESVRRFVDREIVPFHAQWEKDGIGHGAVAQGRCRRAALLYRSGRIWRHGPRLFVRRGRVRRVMALRRQRPGIPDSHRSRGDLSAFIRNGSAKTAMAAEDGVGRGDRLARHDGTACGSDLKAIRTRAVRDGDDFVHQRPEGFISNGQLCDFVVLATKTDGSAGAKGVTLFIVESSRPGFSTRKKSRKNRDEGPGYLRTVLRQYSYSPPPNMLGQEGKGFALMMTKLSQERLAQAIRSATVVETVLDWTVEYTSDRSVFGQKLANFQNTQFKLADLKTKATVARVFTDRCIFAVHGRKARSGRRRDGQDVSLPNFTAKQSMSACNCSAAGAI